MMTFKMTIDDWEELGIVLAGSTVMVRIIYLMLRQGIKESQFEAIYAPLVQQFERKFDTNANRILEYDEALNLIVGSEYGGVLPEGNLAVNLSTDYGKKSVKMDIHSSVNNWEKEHFFPVSKLEELTKN